MNKGQINTNLGQISINPDVIAFYVGMQAVECFGIVGMAAVSVTDGIARLLKRESMTKGISVKIEDNKLVLDFHIIVEQYNDCSIQVLQLKILFLHCPPY